MSPEARDLYAKLLPGSALPDGSIVVAVHHDADRGRPGPVYVMEKRGGAWSYRSLDAEGRPVESSVDLCRRCHAEAPADSLFGVPKGARKPPDE